MEEHTLQNGWFFISFVSFSSTYDGWLILFQTGVSWDIMGYESEPLPSYTKLINCS